METFISAGKCKNAFWEIWVFQLIEMLSKSYKQIRRSWYITYVTWARIVQIQKTNAVSLVRNMKKKKKRKCCFIYYLRRVVSSTRNYYSPDEVFSISNERFSFHGIRAAERTYIWSKMKFMSEIRITMGQSENEKDTLPPVF